MILTIQNETLAVIDRTGTLADSIVSVDGLIAELRRLDCPVVNGSFEFMCSSSIDFPEEYTENPSVIAVCKMLRGAN